MTTAHAIATTPDRTPRERRDWADFRAARWAWVGRDMVEYWFADGSGLLAQLDENLLPVEFVEVTA